MATKSNMVLESKRGGSSAIASSTAATSSSRKARRNGSSARHKQRLKPLLHLSFHELLVCFRSMDLFEINSATARRAWYSVVAYACSVGECLLQTVVY